MAGEDLTHVPEAAAVEEHGVEEDIGIEHCNSSCESALVCATQIPGLECGFCYQGGKTSSEADGHEFVPWHAVDDSDRGAIKGERDGKPTSLEEELLRGVESQIFV